MFPFFNHYPGTDLHEIDLAYILKLCAELRASNADLTAWKAEHEAEYRELKEAVDGLINQLVDVIVPWDSSIEYPIYSIVEYQGTNYIAVQNVPVGAMITDTNYWQPANTVIEQINAIGVTVNDIKEALTYVTPEMYGGIGDGVTDDTAAVQAAVDSGLPCFLGHYYAVSDSIVLGDHATLFGAGRGTGGLKYIGALATDPVVEIPYTSYFCSVHDITVNGGGNAPGVYDCFNKPAGTFVGLRSQIYNLNIEEYTDYGLYLNAMGSEIYNCYITGVYDYSKIGLYVAGTDNRIFTCRLQLNNEYGLYNTASSNVYRAVKSCVNNKGAYITGGFLECDIEIQENRSTGLELTAFSFSNANMLINCNSYDEQDGYGILMDRVRQNNIKITGRKHSTIGTHVAKEKALIYMDQTSYLNNIDATFTSVTSSDYLYIDGLSARNHIVCNGAPYTNENVLVPQGYQALNKLCTYSPVTTGTSAFELNAEFNEADVTLTSTTGNINIFSIVKDFSQYSKVIVILETQGVDGMTDNLRMNYPIMQTTGNTNVSPTHYDIIPTRYIISVFDNTANCNRIMVRTSGSNNCANARNSIKFKVLGLPA